MSAFCAHVSGPDIYRCVPAPTMTGCVTWQPLRLYAEIQIIFRIAYCVVAGFCLVSNHLFCRLKNLIVLLLFLSLWFLHVILSPVYIMCWGPLRHLRQAASHLSQSCSGPPLLWRPISPFPTPHLPSVPCCTVTVMFSVPKTDLICERSTVIVALVIVYPPH